MQLAFSWQNPSLVLCRISGAVKAEDFVALTEAIVSNPRYRPGMNRVIDLGETDATGVTAADVERVADQTAVYAGEIKTGCLALIVGVGSPLKFGLARMFEAYFESQVDGPVAVFKTLDRALAWIDAVDSGILPERGDDAGSAALAGADSGTLYSATD